LPTGWPLRAKQAAELFAATLARRAFTRQLHALFTCHLPPCSHYVLFVKDALAAARGVAIITGHEAIGIQGKQKFWPS
jgi:hypothetical protein